MNRIPSAPTAAVGLTSPGATAQAPAALKGSLLPQPQQAVGSMESLYALMAEASYQQQKNGRIDVQNKFDAKKAALEKYVAEMRKAAEEAKEDSGFLKTLAKVGMVVAAVAATVATWGAAGPVVVAVAIGLSAGGFLVKETKCFGAASAWIGMGMQLGGAVVSGGAGGGAVATTVANSASATSTVLQGVATVNDASHMRDADRTTREAKATQQQMRHLEEAIEDVIANLQDGKQTNDRNMETINQTVQTRGDTLVMAAGARA